MPQTTGFLPGTLDMLILKTLSRGPLHGYGIAQHIRRASEDVLEIGEGSLYPALQKLLVEDLVTAEWSMSEYNRRARFYRLTPAGKKRLASESAEFDRLVAAVIRVMQTA
jgi:transcriptional regulator